MRAKLTLLIALVASAGLAQVAGPEVERLTNEIKEMEQSGVGREMKTLNDRMNRQRDAFNKEQSDIYQKMEQVRQGDAWKTLDSRRAELQKLRRSAWEEDRQRIAEQSKTLYAQRHEELKPLAAWELTEARKHGFDVLNYPRIDGSTSTHPLSIVIAARLLGVPYEWTYPEPRGTPWGMGDLIEESVYLHGSDRAWIIARNSEAEFSLASARMVAKPSSSEQDRLARIINTYLATSASTHQAYLRHAAGECDINLTVRGPSEDELKAAREKGVEFVLVPIARDAVVFMVNTKNPIDTLTREQLRQIFSREITQWSAVGGESRQIRALWRERNSGSRELFDAAIGAKAPEGEPSADGGARASLRYGEGLYAMGMAGPYNQLLQDPDAIAYSVWYYDRYMAMSPQSRTIAVDGVEPTRENLASGKYPLLTTIYAVHRKGDDPESPAMKLIRYLRSKEGQALIQESGYVPYAR